MGKIFLVCERCSERLENFKEGSTQGVRCIGCGWSVVTTHISGAKVDETKYEVSCRGDYRNETHVRVVSELMGCNFLKSRKTLQNGLFLVYFGQAVEVLRVRNILFSRGLDCTVKPDLNWDLSQDDGELI
ncbi:hypothetical protein [Pseudomonas gingeri]|uniref:Uncharacterized protein n=1 Tax=Pseudomonas gingeri TaxID=117681 RepID=A0A7Y7WC24_9PSED|nr:hypothetical protein [Pseudomonas gingeri]NWB46624.1 hypothetical protein [Pseudomonas gingeri]